MIDGVEIKRLRVIPDERGRLMEIFRSDDAVFKKFGQVYMTTTYPGVIKGWHYHKLQEDNIAVIKGMLKVVLFDNRDSSPTKGEVNEFFAGEHNPILIHVPVGLLHGWKCVGETEAIVVNTVTEPYNYENPDEYRLPYNSDDVPYDWDIKMG
jgi:dTDP-4-dehydrorhamnose 3,5-epimerase